MTRRHRSRQAGEPRDRARGSRRRVRGHGLGRHAGYTLVELVVVVGVVCALLTAAVPAFDAAADTAEAAGAARYLASVVARARLDAARGQRTVAVRFARAAPVTFTVIVDGHDASRRLRASRGHNGRRCDDGSSEHETGATRGHG